MDYWVREGFSVHERNNIGRTKWLQQQAPHLFDHARLAECHADVMQSERNVAMNECQQLHAAGVNVVSEAQSEFRAAGEQYEQVREKARQLNTDLSQSKLNHGNAEAEVERLRAVLSEANVAMQSDVARR